MSDFTVMERAPPPRRLFKPTRGGGEPGPLGTAPAAGSLRRDRDGYRAAPDADRLEGSVGSDGDRDHRAQAVVGDVAVFPFGVIAISYGNETQTGFPSRIVLIAVLAAVLITVTAASPLLMT